MKDLYNILGVSKQATLPEIKKAYKKLALEFHPDKNSTPEASDKFIEITEAYEVLTDETRRNHYDQFGTTEQSQFPDFMNMFNPFQQQPMAQQVPPVVIEVTLTLPEVMTGCKKEIFYQRQVVVETCSNKTVPKSDLSSVLSTCPRCKGVGMTMSRQQMGFMMTMTQQVCTTCNGVGISIQPSYSLQTKKCKINQVFPIGVRQRQEFCLPECGNINLKNPNSCGKLVLIVKLDTRDPLVQVDAAHNINYTYTVTILQALVGGVFTLIHPGTNEIITVEFENITPLKPRSKIVGKGLALGDNGKNTDFIILYNITYPKLTDVQKKILNSVNESF